jgi:mono/diheme cytochrome c family protein
MKSKFKNKFLSISFKAGISVFVLILSFAFTQKKEDWIAPASAKNKKNPIEVNAANLASAKKSYEKECLSCHGRKGKGDGPSSVTLDVIPGDLSAAKVQDQTDGELFWKITEGKKPMPTTKLTLTDDQRWAVVNYVRTLKK